MQLAYPDRYGLEPAQASSILLEFRSVVQANHITHVREGGENMAGWLAEMEARREVWYKTQKELPPQAVDIFSQG